MDKYRALARKYRPQSFQDVIGQEAIVTTLKNAMRMGRIAHAYLFCGSRGIGKTTLARLFAKALNCEKPTENFEPCNTCFSCKEIASACSMDVIEIDGASNRGIDDIRQINETVLYAPSSGKYKIYIIDEVHMLTKEAFNALLKTLEDPPERVKFFFATTEPHKILATIISRCQRFDLKRIPNDRIVEKLLSISVDINRQVQKEALQLITHFAEGSLRDAESLFDQLLCYEENMLTAETVREALGLTDRYLFFSIDKAVQKGDTLFAFTFVDEIFSSGKDLAHFTGELVEHYRSLLLAKMWGKKGFSVALSEELQDLYLQTAALYTKEQLFYILDFLLLSMQKHSHQRTHLEMILLTLIRSGKRISLDALVQRLYSLEKKLSGDQKIFSAEPVKDLPKIEQPKEAMQPKQEAEPVKPASAIEMLQQAAQMPKSFSAEEKTQPEPPIMKQEQSVAQSVLKAKIEPKIQEPTQELKLEPVPFQISSVEKTEPEQASIEEKKPPYFYDNLMRFTSVELEGIVKKNLPN